ncbi:MAG TPA: hypothetical protein VD905_18610 [Flavobacteriales bacterium]|nr:hypothetical protein [Flavobacteriales bacterium]
MKHLLVTLLTLVSLASYCQQLNGRYSGKSMLRDYSFDFSENKQFEYKSTGLTTYVGKGNYSIQGNKITFFFFTPEDTNHIAPTVKECGTSGGNVMTMIVRDSNTGMFLACDYEVFDANGKTIQPRKAFLHCLFLNTSTLPEGSYVKIYHDERKTILLKINKNGCNEYLVHMVFREKDEDVKIENGHVWEFNYFKTAKGFMLSEAGQNVASDDAVLEGKGWSDEFIKR